jgi:putative DNA primase/helicase
MSTAEPIPAAWRARAGELADWTAATLVNQWLVFGGYLPDQFRQKVKRDDGSVYEKKAVTKPAKAKRGTEGLTREVIRRHYAGRDVGHIIGLHSIGPDGCRWVGIDIDAHPGQPFDPEANLRAALHWYRLLTDTGHVVLLTDSNGKGGYHLLVIFDRPIPVAQAYAFLQVVVADYATLGLSGAPECYPKQSGLKPGQTCGNWLRLPGRHHTLPHWSRVWDGERWLDGEAAVEFIVALKPGPAELVPDAPPPPPRPKPKPLPSVSPRAGLRTEREIALECLAHLPDHAVDDYAQWVQVGMALHAVDSGPEMRDAWDAWSQRSTKYVRGDCEQKWRGFTAGGGVGVATLIKMARDNGFDVYARGRNGKTGMQSKTSRNAGSKAAEPGEDARGRAPVGDEPESSESPAQPQEGHQLLLDPKNPLDAARRFRATLYAHPDGSTLLFANDVYYRWNGSAYEAVDPVALRKQLYEYTDGAVKWVKISDHESLEPFKPTRSSIDNIADALRAVVHTEEVAPCWLSDEPGLPNPSEIIAARNGLLHLRGSGPVALRKATPLFFSANSIDFDYDPRAPQPRRWLNFLDQTWPDDREAVDLLAEWMGYTLTADTRQQKMLLLVGPPRSGKGTIARVLTSLIGAANVCGPTLSSLATNFGLWPLLGKQLAIISDARLGGRSDQAVITERLLAISGEDAITVDRKNMTSVTGRLPVRIMILTNELPRLADASGALANRFLVLTLEQSFLGREDTNLLDRFLPELPGILLWAIEGRRRLSARGHFVQPGTSADAIGEMIDLSSPVKAFVRECCNVGAGLSVPMQDAYDAFVAWSHGQGTKRPPEANVFGRDLRAAVPGVTGKQRRDGEERVRIYRGIDLTLVGKTMAEAARASRNGQHTGPRMAREGLYA